MSDRTTKRVQLELSKDEYEALRALARERDLSLQELVSDALIDWVERHQQVDPNDLAFGVLDDQQSSTRSRHTETDAGEMDDIVEEWHGDDVTFQLAADPSLSS